MKKGLGILLALLLASYGIVYAQAKKNAYQIISSSGNTITFPYETRDLVIVNGDTDALAVDLTGTRTSCPYGTAGCALIPGGDSLELYDFNTNSIKLIQYTAAASPVTVIAIY